MIRFVRYLSVCHIFHIPFVHSVLEHHRKFIFFWKVTSYAIE